MDYKLLREFVKEAEAKRDMPPFLEQNRPAKAKEVYRALKRDHPTMDAGKKARIANAMAKKASFKRNPRVRIPLGDGFQISAIPKHYRDPEQVGNLFGVVIMRPDGKGGSRGFFHPSELPEGVRARISPEHQAFWGPHKGNRSTYVDPSELVDLSRRIRGEKKAGAGLWDNIHAKRKRIAAGSGERMRRPGSKGAPTEEALEKSKTASLSEKLAEIKYRGKTFPGYNKPIASDRPEKKKMVLAKKGDEVRVIHFGQKGYKHNYSESAKKDYLSRSAGIRGKGGKLTKDDKFSANYWARRELWPQGEPADGTAKDREKKASLRDKLAALITGQQATNVGRAVGQRLSRFRRPGGPMIPRSGDIRDPRIKQQAEDLTGLIAAMT